MSTVSFIQSIPPLAVLFQSEKKSVYRVFKDGVLHDPPRLKRDGLNVFAILPSGYLKQINLHSDNKAGVAKLVADGITAMFARPNPLRFYGYQNLCSLNETMDLILDETPKNTPIEITPITVAERKKPAKLIEGFRVRTAARKLRLVTPERGNRVRAHDLYSNASLNETWEFDLIGSKRRSGPVQFHVFRSPGLLASLERYMANGSKQGAGAIGQFALEGLFRDSTEANVDTVLAASAYACDLASEHELEKYIETAPNLIASLPESPVRSEIEAILLISEYRLRRTKPAPKALSHILRFSQENLPIFPSTLYECRDVLARLSVHDELAAQSKAWLNAYFDWFPSLDRASDRIRFNSPYYQYPSMDKIDPEDDFDAWKRAKKKSA